MRLRYRPVEWALTLGSTQTRVDSFREKASGDGTWINGGFFVFEPGVFDYLGGDDTVLEREPLERLAAGRQLVAYRHHGFWQPMDTLREKYGKHTVFLGASFLAHTHAQHDGERGHLPERQCQLLPGETARKRLGIPMFLGEVH